jgi:outer membrane lipoprotein carrier protein
VITALVSAIVAMAQPPAAAPAPPGAGSKLDVAAVVAKVQKRYDEAADFKARFTQTLTSAALTRTTNSSGQVTFKKPGRMRWDYEKPDKSSYITDGGVLWLYEPDDKQAFKQDLKASQLPAALAFLMGKGKLASEFDITFGPERAASAGGPGAPKNYVLSLSPKTPQAQVKSIVFVVDPHDWFVRQSEIVDAQGNTNVIVFSDVVMNSKVPDALFHFTPPAGTRVIDTGKLGK